MNGDKTESLKRHIEKLKNPRLWKLFGLEMFFFALYLAFDLLTKEYIYGTIVRSGEDIVIWDGVIRFVAVENKGASFGAFSDSTVILTIISFIASIALLFVIIATLPERNAWLRSALVLMLAGGVGNLVDRLAFGYVRDFFYFELIDFAVFNFADSALTVGAVCLIVYVFFFYARKKEDAAEKLESEVKNEAPSECTHIEKEEGNCDNEAEERDRWKKG